jgi:hypothetical protein
LVNLVKIVLGAGGAAMIDTVNLYDAKTNLSKLADWPTPYDRADLVRDAANGIAINAATVWEIAIKRAIGKLRFGRPVVAAVLALGFDILRWMAPPMPSMPTGCHRITMIHSIA